MELKDFSTKEITDELAKREAVEKIIVNPYDDFNITVDENEVSTEISTGPCNIFVVWD